MIRRPATLYLLAGVLYFSEGLPYGLVTELFPLYLRQQGSSLIEIGFLSTIALAWTIKFLWAPLVDRFGSYRQWIGVSLAALTASLALFAFFDTLPPAILWAGLAIIALASATQDIAVDATTIVATPTAKLGKVNAIRITTYRIALIVAGGALAAVASWYGWKLAFGLAAGTCFALLLFNYVATPGNRGSGRRENLVQVATGWARRSHLLTIVALVLLYRFGDSALAPMIKPLWLDRGFSPAEIGTVTTIIGISFTIVGGFVGGFVIERIGILSSLLVLGVLQAGSNIGYALAAAPGSGWQLFYGAAVIESFAGGLGIAAFLSFLMSLCNKERAATEYALLTALFGLSRSIAGSMSGFFAEALGYEQWFWITVALGLPGLALVVLLMRQPPSAMEPVAEPHPAQ
jgi:MFS transporter, PAT family, beta-lactamase induction signal transducer AmpG